MSVTAKFLHVYLLSKKFRTQEKKVEHKLLDVPQGCCGVKSTGTRRSTIMQWLYKPVDDSDTTHEGAMLYVVKGVAIIMDGHLAYQHTCSYPPCHIPRPL